MVSFKVYLSRESEHGQSKSDNASNDGGQGLEEGVEVFLAQIGAQIIDKAVNLAEPENSQTLK